MIAKEFRLRGIKFNINNVFLILDNFFKNADNSTNTRHLENTDTEILKNAVTKESDKIRTKPSFNEDGTEIKLEPDNLNDSMVDASKQIENKSDNSELSQNVEIFDEHLSDNMSKQVDIVEVKTEPNHSDELFS